MGFFATYRTEGSAYAKYILQSKYNPEASLRDQLNVAGYERAQTLVEVLRKCGDELTRANVMKQAVSLDLEFGMLRPPDLVQTAIGLSRSANRPAIIRVTHASRRWRGKRRS